MKTYFILIFLTGSIFFFKVLNHVVQDDTVRNIVVSGTIFHVDTLKNINQLFTDDTGIPAKMSEFPTLHPLIVHFAVALIPLAFIIQLINLFLMKIIVYRLNFFILLSGVAGGILAAYVFHPDAEGLTNHAQKVFMYHFEWAQWTIIAGALSVILYLVFFFLMRKINKIGPPSERPGNIRKFWVLSLLITVVLGFAAFSVSRTGHVGSQLVHIEGVGPKGEFLDHEETR